VCRKFDRPVPARPPLSLLLIASVGDEARRKDDAAVFVALDGQV
jgi:hypothetical protein